MRQGIHILYFRMKDLIVQVSCKGRTQGKDHAVGTGHSCGKDGCDNDAGQEGGQYVDGGDGKDAVLYAGEQSRCHNADGRAHGADDDNDDTAVDTAFLCCLHVLGRLDPGICVIGHGNGQEEGQYQIDKSGQHAVGQERSIEYCCHGAAVCRILKRCGNGQDRDTDHDNGGLYYVCQYHAPHAADGAVDQDDHRGDDDSHVKGHAETGQDAAAG